MLTLDQLEGKHKKSVCVCGGGQVNIWLILLHVIILLNCNTDGKKSDRVVQCRS